MGDKMKASAIRRPRFDAACFAGLAGLSIATGLTLTSPAHALDTTLENVVIEDSDKGALRLGRVEITGANLTQEELAKLFAASTPAADGRALAAKLKADKIAIPEAVFTKKDTKVTVANIVAANIVEGKVGRAGFAGIDGTIKPDDGDAVTIKSGPLALDGSDLSALLTMNAGSASFSRFSWEGLAITAPDKDTPKTAAGGNLYAINLGALAVDATFDGGVMLKGAVSLKGLSIQPPSASQAGQQLAAAGYGKLDLALNYVGVYDPAAKTYSLDDFTINGVNAGSLQLKSRFGALDKAAFSGSSAERMGALLQGNISAVELVYADAGLAEKLIVLFARQQQKAPDALRAETAAMAKQIIPALIGGAPNASAIADAVSSFVATPTTLTVTMRPKSGAIGFADLMQINNPAAFLEKINLDVRSGSGPAAAPAAAAVTPPPAAQASAAPAAAAAPRRLTGLDAWNALVGNTIAGKNSDGDPLFEFYTKDGVVKQLDDDETATGKWSVKAGKVCFEFPDDDEETCYKVTVDGNVATFTDDDGSGKRYEILTGNPKRL